MPVVSEIMAGIIRIISATWWIVLAFFFFYMFSKYYASETIKLGGKKIKLKELQLYSHFLGLFLGLYVLQRFAFGSVRGYFCASSLIFWIVGTSVWMIAKRGRHVISVETRLQGEILWKYPGLAAADKLPIEFPVNATGTRIMKIPMEIYSEKEHIGSSKMENWKFGNVVYCDYYNGEFFWHPEFPELHNIGMISRKAFWLYLKKKLPKIRMEMIELTWLREWWLLDSMEQAKDRAYIGLKEMKLTHPKPFDMAITNDDLMKRIREKGLQILSLQELHLDKNYQKADQNDKDTESAAGE